MGTSTNQASPNTPNWRAAQLAYLDASLSVERAVQEVWRAATNQPAGDIADGLSDSIIGECLAITVSALSRDAAVAEASQRIASSGQASLAAVIAQRAVALSFRAGTDRASAYTKSLFEEASNYLVSRDLPGYVGSGRAQTVSDAIEFKAQLVAQTSRRVLEVPLPPSTRDLVQNWSGYVHEVVDRLRASIVRER